MTTVRKFTKNGKAHGKVELNATIFAGPVNESVVHTVVTGQLRNRRQGTAKTKERGEKAYSTKKPWRQKGTGRARAGRRNSPIWRGGGTTFGPRTKDWNRPIPKTLRRTALKSIVLDRAANEQMIVVEDLPWTKPETKVAAAWLKTLDLAGPTLVITAEPDTDSLLSLRNIPGVEHTFVGQLSAADVATHKHLVFTADALVKLEETLA